MVEEDKRTSENQQLLFLKGDEMKLVHTKTIPYSTYALSISADNQKIAICRGRCVSVLAVPSYTLRENIPVKHPSCAVFMEDNSSVLVLTTQGQLFIWDGTNVENLGKLPISHWDEKPIYYIRNNWIVCGTFGGIWKYNIRTKELCKIYSTKHFVDIVKVVDKIIYCTVSQRKDIQIIQLLKIDINGSVISEIWTQGKLLTRSIEDPAWTEEGKIAISTVAAPTITHPRPRSLLYLIDESGQICAQRHIPNNYDSGKVIFGANCIAVLHGTIPTGVTFYDSSDLSFLGELNDGYFSAKNADDPPACMYFTQDGTVYLGTWHKLLVYKLISE